MTSRPVRMAGAIVDSRHAASCWGPATTASRELRLRMHCAFSTDERGSGATTDRVDRINAFLQTELRRRRIDEAAAVDAARWLDTAGLLNDSGSRPGLPLRNLLRANRIQGGTQRPPTSHGRWYIERLDAPRPGAQTGATNARRKREARSAPVAGGDAGAAARRRRERAAKKYRAAAIELLLVAEAPPAALDRYFYYEDVPRQDSLFRYVARAILNVEPTRGSKAELLGRLRDRGVFLVDLKRDPVTGGSLAAEVPGLVRRVRRLAPARIIVIKSSVFDLVRDPLLDAGLPLVDERVPFPGSGQQRRFEKSFARALRRKPLANAR
jgi:hypothetical protein